MEMKHTHLITLDVNHNEKSVAITVIDETSLPKNASIVITGQGECVRWDFSNGSYKTTPIQMKGLEQSLANRLKHNLLDSYSLNGYENAKLIEPECQDDGNLVLAVWSCPITMMYHVTMRKMDDARCGINWSNFTITWPCDDIDAGIYHIIKINLSKENWTATKKQVKEHFESMGFTGAGRRDKVPYYVRKARELSKQFSI